VFRYSAWPGTPATRMTGQVDERTRKARAAELLTLAAESRAAFARRVLGTTTRVLVETQLSDGRWIGHADDHVVTIVTAVASPVGHRDAIDLENAMLTVRRAAVDAYQPDRVEGEILAVDPAPRQLRPTLAVLGGTHAR